MKTDISNILEKYIGLLVEDETHRYNSWNRCFKVFKSSEQTEYHALELGFYLASWGMYRGSSGLLQKNHLIHKAAVDIIYKPEFESLKCSDSNDINSDKVELILTVKSKLANYYKNINYVRGGETKWISDTDTLISKILLGTLGCVPAYDDYFIKGLKEKGLEHKKFKKASINELLAFVKKHNEELKLCQAKFLKEQEMYYPTMKLVDIYFWQTGFDKDLQEKKLKKEQNKTTAII